MTRATLAVEGDVDAVVLRRLCAQAGIGVGPVYGRNGKDELRKKIHGYNSAARLGCWIVLVDLDRESCAPSLLRAWLASASPRMCLRVAVRAVEAWLLADVDRVAGFLRVRRAQVPARVDEVDDPKAKLVQLAASSKSSIIRDDMVPRPRSGARVGPAYTSRLIEFVTDTTRGWRPEVARRASPSLDRCLRDLERRARG